MATLNVQLPGGNVQVFNGVDLGITVGAFKAVIGEKIGMANFKLHGKNIDGGLVPTETLIKRDVHDLSLAHVGFKDGGVLRVAKPSNFSAAKQAQRRLDKGVTQCATSLKNLPTSVGGVASAVTSMQADVTAIRNAVVAAPPVKIPGETELMEAVLNKFKVNCINGLLNYWMIERPRGVNKNGKALLLVQKAPMVELRQAVQLHPRLLPGEVEEDLGLDAADAAQYRVRLAAQQARVPLDNYNEAAAADA